MFSATNSCRATAACALMMMVVMMMMSETAAMPKGKTHRKSSEDAETIETVPLQLNPNAFIPTRSIRPLHNVSISPWTYNVSRDDAVFPPVLAEAHCSLKGCLDSEGKEDRSLESHPIMHQVLQLRRVRSAGSGVGHGYHYRLESRLVAVGCTCIRPSVRIQH